MPFDIKKREDYTDIILQGNVRIADARSFWSALQDAVSSKEAIIRINWDRLERVDTSIIQLILSLKKSAGDRVIIRDPSPQVKEIIDLTGLKLL